MSATLCLRRKRNVASLADGKRVARSRGLVVSWRMHFETSKPRDCATPPKMLLIAADVDRSFHERAASDGRFEIIDRPVRTEDDLAAVVADCQVLVTRSYNRVTRRVIDRAPRLELIAQGTSGTDNID